MQIRITIFLPVFIRIISSPEITLVQKDRSDFYWRRGAAKPVKYNGIQYDDYGHIETIDWDATTEEMDKARVKRENDVLSEESE